MPQMLTQPCPARLVLAANPAAMHAFPPGGAAHFACQHDERSRRFYDRKKQKTNPVVATKALACKRAKASWHVMHDDAPYDPQRVFGGGKE